MPSASGVLGANPVSAPIASTEANVSSTSDSGRGASRTTARRPSACSSSPTSVADLLAAMVADIQHPRRRWALGRPVQAAHHPGHDVVDVGEIPPQRPALVERDRLARDDRSAKL